MIEGVDRILLRVGSVAAAVAYYRDTLGMKLVRAEKTIAAFELAGGIELVLHESPDLPAQGVYFRVGSVDSAYRDRERLRLKFTSSPRTVSRGRSAAVRDPFGNVLLLLDRTLASADNPATATVESAKPAGGALFEGVETRHGVRRAALVAAYEKIGRTADDLPYTHHFESLYSAYVAAFDPPGPTRQETWRHLLNTRKAGKLPRLGEARSAAPDLSDEDRATLTDLLAAAPGGAGKRDRLPYTRSFEQLVEAFNRQTRKGLTPHQLWRAIATLAK